MQNSYWRLINWVTLLASIVPSGLLAGCGGGNSGLTTRALPQNNAAQASSSKVVTLATTPRPGPTMTPKPTPTATPRPTPTPKPTPTIKPTPTPSGPAPVAPPAVVFDLRGRVLIGGAPSASVVVQVVGVAGAVTASDQTVSGAGGFYSFFLGGGTYIVTALEGKHRVTRRVTIPGGGQTVDNFDLTL